MRSFVHGDDENEIYWFHSDHLGSTSYITNLLGEVSQHMEYFAFGETFVEEHRSSNNSPYKFNGKELDEETGWYYYGARYYDPRISIWLSVDPLANVDYLMNDEAYINGEHNGGVYNSFNHNSYGYCYQNPIVLIDPDGKQTMSGWTQGMTHEQTTETLKGMHETNRTVLAPILSTIFDFLPIAGDIKGWYESISGEDVLTGDKLTGFERAAGIVLLSEVKIIGKINKVVDSTKGVKKYDVGTFEELQKKSTVGDGLDLHHVPQKKPAAQVIEGYDPKTAPAIAIPNSQHKNIPTKKGLYDGTARDQLSKDAKDLINAGVPNNKVKEVIDYNKNKYPNAYKK